MRLVTNRESLPLRRPELRLEATGGVHRVLDPRDGRTYALNPTALALWQLCDGTTQPDEMVEAICELFAVERRQAAADVERTLGRFTEAGLIEWREKETK